MISRMFPENGGRIGTYYYLFPTYAQGKKILWDGIDGSGQKFLDHFPSGLIQSKNETELQVTLTNGAIFQVVGTDKIDSIVGTNPVGCAFSEYAIQNPKAWDLIRPILLENDGWAVFPYTPRGHNHGKTLYEMALNNPAWFCQKLTVADTYREDGRYVMSPEMIEAERAEGMHEELVQQEYYCSFEGYQEGSYYSQQLRDARKEGRIGSVPWISTLPVFTFWDIGYGDSTAIWFGQRVGNKRHFIDYYEQSGELISHYAKVLKDKPYVYSRHYWPHDGSHGSMLAHSTRDAGEALGIRPIDIVPRGDVQDGIQAVRGQFSTCYFDGKCEKGLNSLSSYHKEWDDDRKEFKLKPFHDWASNGADAFRTMAKSDWMTVDQDSNIVVNLGFDARELPTRLAVNQSFDPRR